MLILRYAISRRLAVPNFTDDCEMLPFCLGLRGLRGLRGMLSDFTQFGAILQGPATVMSTGF
jgi:hypothetical protein